MEDKDAYICYNRADSEFVLRLAEQLESETIDGQKESRKIRVFFDRWDIDHGNSLIDAMNEGMKQARHILTVLSPEFLEADWPRFEWKHFLADDPNNTKGKIVPLLRRDVSMDEQRRIDLCAPFRDLKYIDFRKESEFRYACEDLVRRIRRLPLPRGRTRPPIAPMQSSSVLPDEEDSNSSWLPDRLEELLLSNLFSVQKLPTEIWGGKTEYRKKTDVWDEVGSCSPFILRSGLLFTFADLSNRDEPLKKVIGGTVEKHCCPR